MTWPLVLPVTLWALFPAPILAPGVGRPKAQILGEALASVLLLCQGTPLAAVPHLSHEWSGLWNWLTWVFPPDLPVTCRQLMVLSSPVHTRRGSRAFPTPPPLHPSPSILLPSIPHPTSWSYLELVTSGSTFKYLRQSLADAGPRNFRGSSGRAWASPCPSSPSPPLLPKPGPLSSSLWGPGRTTCILL